MSMTWNDYQQQALTTAIYPLKREVEYTVLGLLSEVAELAEWLHPDYAGSRHFGDWLVNMKKEVGDCFWYVAALADALKTPLEAVARSANRYHYQELDAAYLTLVQDAGYLQGLVKKSIRDDAGHLTEDRRIKMIATLARICWALDNICDQLATSRYAVMNDNLNKLASRKQRGVLKGSGDAR
jgi:NTP pyrophosphatase (non-canonical NTP hydrolase)